MDTTNNNPMRLDSMLPNGEIYNPELERMVIAALITSYASIVDTADILFDDCFYDSRMREIYNAVKTIYNRGDAPDRMLVSSELAKTGSTIKSPELLNICTTTEIPFDITEHALILRDLSMRRKLWQIGNELTTQAADESNNVENLHNNCLKSLQGLFDFGSTDLKSLEDTFKQMLNIMIENQNRPEGEIIGTPTGFEQIDRTGGLCGTDLIVVGAETSQGKTSFATALTLSAISHGDAVAFYSMEMLPVQLTARIAAMKSGVSSMKIMRDRLGSDEIERVSRCMADVDMSKLHFDGRSSSSHNSILMSIRRMKMKKDIKGAVVDYLQLVKPDDSKQNREQAIGAIARDFKNLARDLDIWIILISQLSRDRQNPYPTLARLRDSGQIEEAADVIYLIYRSRNGKGYPEPFDNITTEGTAMISIAKGRNIGTSQFICGFQPETTTFFPLSQVQLSGMNFSNPDIQGAEYSIEEDVPF